MLFTDKYVIPILNPIEPINVKINRLLNIPVPPNCLPIFSHDTRNLDKTPNGQKRK